MSSGLKGDYDEHGRYVPFVPWWLDKQAFGPWAAEYDDGPIGQWCREFIKTGRLHLVRSMHMRRHLEGYKEAWEQYLKVAHLRRQHERMVKPLLDDKGVTK